MDETHIKFGLSYLNEPNEAHKTQQTSFKFEAALLLFSLEWISYKRFPITALCGIYHIVYCVGRTRRYWMEWPCFIQTYLFVISPNLRLSMGI